MVCDFRGKWKVSDGAEHEVITDRWEVKERGEGGESRLFLNVLEGRQRKREGSRTAKSGLKNTESGEVHLGTENRIHKQVQCYSL